MLMTIKMNNNNEAIKAMEIIKSVIESNKEYYNKGYRSDACALFLNAISINDNCLEIPDELFGCFLPEDPDACIDIINAIATQAKNKFEASIFITSDYAELWIEAVCDGKELTTKTTYFPSGFDTTYICEDCEEEFEIYEEIEVAPNKYELHIFDEFASGTYTCPNCGEEIDFTDVLPIIETTTKNI